MAISTIDESQRQAPRVAGFMYLFLGVSAYFAEFYVRSNLIVYGDAAKTASNIMGVGIFGVATFMWRPSLRL